MWTKMRIVSPEGEDCNMIMRRSFTTVMFASQVEGLEIGGPNGITVGEPVIIEAALAEKMIPFLAELGKRLYDYDQSLEDVVDDLEHLTRVLNTYLGCTLIYAP